MLNLLKLCLTIQINKIKKSIDFNQCFYSIRGFFNSSSDVEGDMLLEEGGEFTISIISGSISRTVRLG